ncbi:MAG: NHL repeat-containing protein [Nitrospirae bacterium]|nr:NHL repeat-containing protein [Nitrospirota bacterium]
MRGALIKIMMVMAAIMLLPADSFSAGAVKIMHVQSIYSDSKGAGLRHPEGVTCNEEALVIVADSENGRLLRYTYKDQSVKQDSEIKVPELSYPIVVRLNSKGDVFALDSRSRRIARLSNEGKFIGYLEPSGLPSPESFVPRSFDIDRNDNIYILDIFSRRVLVLNPEGTFQKLIPFPGSYGFFSDVSVDFKDNVLLLDGVNARIFTAAKNATVFSPLTESLKQFIRFPTSMATDNRGRIYLTDRNGSRIIAVGQDGSYLGQLSERGWKEGLLNYPSQICINDQGDFFIADTDNNRVQIFTILK